jgi:uncharacterized protein YdbL (DUF1318 family)
MKLHKKNGISHSVMLYKKQHGRKLIAAGSSGTESGKESLIKTINDDNTQKRAWGEVSHAMKKVYNKAGMPLIDNNKAEELTGKKIIRKHSDGQYDREIGGQVHTKTMMGHIKQ